MKIHEFPEGDELWLVKWIDRYALWHRQTYSPSVTVVLQMLDLAHPQAALDDLSEEQVQAILADRSPHWRFEIRQVHAGFIPALEIGDVYRDQLRVGGLPSKALEIELEMGESTARQARLQDQDETARIFGATAVKSTLSRKQFVLGTRIMEDCQALVIRQGEIDVVLPRQVIFQSFYAATTPLANAFTSGAWTTTSQLLVYTQPLDNGLKTGVDPNTGEWYLVLQPDIPSEFARMIALLYFDGPGRACADAIFADMHIDVFGSKQRQWYCNARLPYGDREPVRLSVRGFPLGDWAGRPQRSSSTFLVTHIMAANEPAYARQIYLAVRRNDEESLAGDGEPSTKGPRAGPPKMQDSHNGTGLTGETDAGVNTEIHLQQRSGLQWTNERPVRLQFRIKSQPADKRRKGGRVISPPVRDLASAGMQRPGKHNADTALFSRTTSQGPSRLRMLRKALDELVAGGHLQGWSVVAPPANRIKRLGDFDCWNLLRTEEVLGLKKKPVLSWRAYNYVHVLNIHAQGTSALWFELTCKNRSSCLVTASSEEHGTIIPLVLDLIGLSRGINMVKPLEDIAKDFGCMTTVYRHDYRSERSGGEEPELSARSVLNAIERVA